MNTKSKIFGIITASLFVVGVVVVVALMVRTSADELRVGYMRIASHAPLISAIENNFFERYNLKVRAEYYPTTADLIEALEQRKIDVAFQVTPDLAWKSASRTKKDYYVYYVAQSTKEKPMDGFYAMGFVSRDSLVRQTIGYFLGVTGECMTKEILKKKYGLLPTEYTLLGVNPAMQINLLTRGEIKGLFTYEPVGTILTKAYGAVNVIPAPVEEFVIEKWSGGIGVFSADLVKYRKEAAVNFQRAIVDSYEYLNKDTSKYTKTLMELQPGLTEEVARDVPNISLLFSTDKEKSAMIENAIALQFRVYQSLGILGKDDSHYLKIFGTEN
jgi:ABC-type nitrate/sulfonate/bicarbonate transport system substrate-binding protein